MKYAVNPFTLCFPYVDSLKTACYHSCRVKNIVQRFMRFGVPSSVYPLQKISFHRGQKHGPLPSLRNAHRTKSSPFLSEVFPAFREKYRVRPLRAMPRLSTLF